MLDDYKASFFAHYCNLVISLRVLRKRLPCIELLIQKTGHYLPDFLVPILFGMHVRYTFFFVPEAKSMLFIAQQIKVKKWYDFQRGLRGHICSLDRS